MTCEDFERRLERWIGDAPLGAHERALGARHLAACPRCRDLVELAALAAGPVDSADPGPGFVEEVLARTVGARRRDRWAQIRSNLLRRPRFAWEVAYVLTLVLAPLVLWTGAPERTAALVGQAGRVGRIGSVAVAAASRDLTAGAADRVGSLGTAAGTEARTFGTRIASSLERGRDEGPDDPNPEKGDAP